MTYPIQVTIILWCLALVSLGGCAILAAYGVRKIVNQWDQLIVEMYVRRRDISRWKPQYDALKDKYDTLEIQYDTLFERYSERMGD